jgi:hypothetical protein
MRATPFPGIAFKVQLVSHGPAKKVSRSVRFERYK